jgi:hypothetical protein
MIDEERVQDPTTAALEGLANAAEASSTELRDMQQDLSVMKEERRRGRTWRQIMSTSAGPQPLVHIARIAADLAAAGGTFRRALAKALRSEGMNVTAIAGLFDVSRQRVSTLIRSDSAVTDAEV